MRSFTACVLTGLVSIGFAALAVACGSDNAGSVETAGAGAGTSDQDAMVPSAGNGGTGSGGNGGTGSGGNGGTGSGGNGGTGSSGTSAPEPGTPRDAVNVFLSGHSGFGTIMPAMLDQIADAAGRDHNYNLQMGIGSSNRARLSGMGQEQDRDGHALPFDVHDEIPNATTIGGEKYDTLVVTESLHLIAALTYGESVPSLRAFYDLLMQSDPSGTMYLFDMWETIEGGDFDAWAQKTRDELVMWECLASAVNKDPAVSGNPIQMLPAGMAFLPAVEAAQAGTIPGVAATDFFSDDLLHNTELGNYYIALVMYAALYRRAPSDTPTTFTTPVGTRSVPSEAAPRLEEIAWQAVSDFYAMPPNAMRSMSECRAAIAPFCANNDCNNRIAMAFAD